MHLFDLLSSSYIVQRTVCRVHLFFPFHNNDKPYDVAYTGSAGLPILEIALIKPQKNDKPDSKRITEKVHDVYVKLLEWNFRHAWLTISAGVLSIIVALLITPHIKFRMMPVAERDQFAVEIYLPDGSTIQETASIADSMRLILSDDKRVKSITQFVGMSSPRFHLSYAPKMPSDSYAQFIVNTGSTEETQAVLDEYTNKYANYFENAYIKFKQIDFQHVPSYEFRFIGEDTEEIKNASAQLSEYMRSMPELTYVHTDWGEKLPVIDVKLNPVSAAQLGVTRSVTAANLMLATGDFKMGSITEDNENIPIVLKPEQLGENLYLKISRTCIFLPLFQL
jgi:multidrug efflux pump subunit AcrB